MYIDVKINEKPIRAMVDTGANHNCLACTEIERLELVLERGSGKVKAINSTAQPIARVAKLGGWARKVSQPCNLVRVLREMNLFLCTLRLEEIEKVNGLIPIPIKRFIQEFEDIIPDELAKKLPPRRTIDHEIEFIPSAKPPARAPYRMPQPQLEELRK
ncbi:uncharacterized protein LOC111375284 [Olea europaea var. sylvestris]|uniref:uncharacterized protein LOC111375284 n=1 Tax=Olea europaea var. sylvestris TaxID=158386 RepID=UPI000C1D5AAB|nr:uncharacterized protein LOC111375284 [Olea europaea var. sylvestris]